MPALAKQALSENGISPRPSANGKSSGAKKGDSADVWSKAQTDALVLVSLHITIKRSFWMYDTHLPCVTPVRALLAMTGDP